MQAKQIKKEKIKTKKHKKINNFIKVAVLSVALLLLATLFAFTKTQKADLVVFSFNRPIQLYALLESTNYYIKGLDQIHVIYRTAADNYETEDNYERGYQVVKQTFPTVIFHKQGQNPQLDFKPLTLKAAFESPCKYIIFAVDDIIVKDFIDVSKSIKLLEQTNAYGFYFRLGLNIDYCYAENRPTPAPPTSKITNDGTNNSGNLRDSVYAWVIRNGQGDWGYPNTVDMTLYKKSDIEQIFRYINYPNPNLLEGYWASCNIAQTRNRTALCYKESKIVNLPLNIVQHVAANRNMNAISTRELLDKFNQGLKIDIKPLYKIQNKSPHMDYMPSFIER